MPQGTELAAAQGVAAAHAGDFVLCGVGESMAPRYLPGTVLVVHPTSYFMLRRGMAVVYRNRAGRDVAHVVIEENDRGWLAQGVNNPAPDAERVTAENLVGVITFAFVAEEAPFRSDVASQLAMDTAPRTGARISLLH